MAMRSGGGKGRGVLKNVSPLRGWVCCLSDAHTAARRPAGIAVPSNSKSVTRWPLFRSVARNADLRSSWWGKPHPTRLRVIKFYIGADVAPILVR